MAYGTNVSTLFRYFPKCRRERRTILHVVFFLALFFLSGFQVQGQSLTAHLTVVSQNDVARVRIEGTFAGGSTTWSFPNSYGRVIGLGARIKNLVLSDEFGAQLATRSVGPGEYKAERPATHFTYEVELRQPFNPADASHVSTLNSEYGYLMLADLLPSLPGKEVHVSVTGPWGWSVRTSFVLDGDGFYDLSDRSTGVFFLARDLREKRQEAGPAELLFVTAGEWPFAPGAVTKIAGKIVADYRRRMGYQPKGRLMLMLAPLPGTVGAERWSAETRGSSIVLLMGRQATAKSLLGQLSVVLSHEAFHLWVPNSLALEGDYDWFFEGFTLYQALRCAVRLGFIDFQEYLDTLARVYVSYRATGELDGVSLLEASRRRWTSGSSLVYDKGMLLAFLYDLQTRKASANRLTIDDVYQDLFRRFPTGSAPVDGNVALISALARQVKNEQFSPDYIQGAVSINLEAVLPDYGFRVINAGNKIHLQVAESLTSSQRAMLTSLGYRK